MTTTEQTIQERLALGLGDIAVLIFDMGVHYGLGQPWTPPLSSSARDMAETVKARWHSEMCSMRQWTRGAAPGEIPDWLAQAIAQHHEPPASDRPIAFGPAPLPSGGDPRRSE